MEDRRPSGRGGRVTRDELEVPLRAGLKTESNCRRALKISAVEIIILFAVWENRSVSARS